MTGTKTKRGQNRWLLRLCLGRDSQTGKQIRPTKTVSGTSKEADKALRDWIREYETGGLTTGGNMLLNDYLNEWLEMACRNQVAERTFTDYRSALERRVRKTIGRIPLGKLSPMNIQSLYTEMINQGLSVSSVRRVHVPLARALKQAVRWRRISYNPATDVELPRAKGERKNSPKPMTREQVGAFLEASVCTGTSTLWEVAVASGMRPSELLALTWDVVDWQSNSVRVEKAVSRPKGKPPALREPKTPKSRRTIPLPDRVMDGLREHRVGQNYLRLKSGDRWNCLNLVFPNQKGELWDYSNFAQRLFKPTLKKAGLKGFSPYSLRHTCATLLLLANENPKVVSERLGHSTIALTLDTYSHVLPTMQQGATEKIAGLLFG